MIGLMDCNNFFVSCERLFRPDLKNKPVAVLSSNDGCIVSRSQEVKDFGIPMGIPYFEIKEICEKQGITLFSSNFTLYRDISSRVMSALEEEFEGCEIYSVDEAFFNVPDDIDITKLFDIRTRITQKTGIPVSLGVAQTKTIAKVANSHAKKGSGVCILAQSNWDKITQDISCGSVWGIGRQTSEKLTKMGVSNVRDLLALDRGVIRQSFGVVGERLWLELSGTSVNCVGEHTVVGEQSMSSTRSFSKKTHEKAVILSALGYHATQVGKKLREHGVAASKVTVIVAPSRFSEYALRPSSASFVLPAPTNDTIELIRAAKHLLGTLYDEAIPYGKAGVIVHGIVPTDAVSGSLFENPGYKEKNLSMVIDKINERFGNEAIHSGIVMSMHAWRERAELKSPEYTTAWSQIVRVKATL
jgi:DNA polymerase V